MAKDYYKILGVEKSASADEIKSAYRKLAKQYHPDLHPGDEAAAEKFKECNEAYSVLGDEDKRKKYDNGELDDNGNYNPFSGQGGFSASGFDDIFDIFSGFMGGGARRSAQRESVGSDVQQRLELTFMEAIRGVKKSVSFARVEKCPDCHGSGAKDDRSVKTCDKCGGSGQTRYTQSTIFGQQTVIGECDKCHGSGKIITDPCKTCGGKGTVRKNKVINVTIPAGVENGAVLQLAGEGNAARGNARSGNLLLILSVKPSKVFRRENLDLYVDVPVSFSMAVNGGEVEIPAADGKFVAKLPECTQNGEVLRYRGKGVKTARGASGDLYARIVVEVPKTISRAQRKAMEDFERDSVLKNYPKRREFLDEITKLYEN